jgi:hypothetical protein
MALPSAVIPTLAYLPPTDTAADGPNGTLVAAGQVLAKGTYRLVLSRSEDLGATWSAVRSPVAMPAPFAASDDLEQPQLGYDSTTGKVFLFFTVVVPTPHGGGCDFGDLNEMGFWLVTSTDRGKTWGAAVDVQTTLPNLPNLNSSVCLAPNAGAGIQLRAGSASHPGRLVFSGQTDSCE